MTRCRTFKTTRCDARRQDAPLAHQLKATREKDPQASHTYPSLAESQSSFGASGRGGSSGRQTADRMNATNPPTEVSYAN